MAEPIRPLGIRKLEHTTNSARFLKYESQVPIEDEEYERAQTKDIDIIFENLVSNMKNGVDVNQHQASPAKIFAGNEKTKNHLWKQINQQIGYDNNQKNQINEEPSSGDFMNNFIDRVNTISKTHKNSIKSDGSNELEEQNKFPDYVYDTTTPKPNVTKNYFDPIDKDERDEIIAQQMQEKRLAMKKTMLQKNASFKQPKPKTMRFEEI